MTTRAIARRGRWDPARPWWRPRWASEILYVDDGGTWPVWFMLRWCWTRRGAERYAAMFEPRPPA